MAAPLVRIEGRKPYREHSLEEVAEALRQSKGMVSQAARILGLSQQAVRQRIAKYATLQQVLADAREAMTDTAELALYNRIVAGDGWAVCFYLKTQGRGRGYVERHEYANAPGESFTVTVDPKPWREALAPFMPPSEDDAGAP